MLIDAIRNIRTAIESSAATGSDASWLAAVKAAGLQSQGDNGTTGIDENYEKAFGPVTLRVKHTWRDTSKTFAPGPDRTRVRLDVIVDGAVIDSYTDGYEQ
jgi:hypothetical protein